ncbi:hypothetical protein GCM10010346_65980 [Streptomyces chryseus]|uniref:Methyltransferase n=1 Tax=Streptomyces chryseus TaxID=68186 RepID=A0ABQ3EKE5_9ACTN|nr:hypothetical protein GCM10010346_65980 [Streptomyces chryseus]
MANPASFKLDPVNFELALWGPQVNGVRYRKAFIFEIASRLTLENRTRLRRIRHRETGAPLGVTHDGDSVRMEHLLAVHESEFISRHVGPGGARVLQVGAGYGRTCHSTLSHHRAEERWIADPGRALSLSREHLRAVLGHPAFSRVGFVSVDDADDPERAASSYVRTSTRPPRCPRRRCATSHGSRAVAALGPKALPAYRPGPRREGDAA